jgi:hypothetical protein
VRSAKVYGILDAVAGALFVAYVAALRPGAALSLIGAGGGGQVSFEAWRPLDVPRWAMRPKASMASARAKPSQRSEIGFGAAFWLRSRALHDRRRL